MDRAKPLGLTETSTLIIGAMIGSGILVLPGLMIAQVKAPILVVAALVLGGLLSWLGALVFAELGAMFPRGGGQVHYLREGLGPVWGHLYGWAMFWIVLSGVLAGIVAALGNFVGVLLPLGGQATPLVLGGWETGLTLPAWGPAFVAIAAIWALVLLNLLGAKAGGIMSNVSTVAKYLGLLAVAVVLYLAEPAPDAFQPGGSGWDGALQGATFAGFAAALAFGLFSYDGWVTATFVAGEVREPRRTLPRALFLGPLVVTAIYIVITVAYFLVLSPAAGVAVGEDPEGLVAVSAVEAALGADAGKIIAIVAVVSLLGTTNAFVLAAPRVFHAMGRTDRPDEPGLGRLTRKEVPVTAMVYVCLWSSVLVMTGLFASLVYMVVFAQWAFYGLTAIAHMRLRRKAADADRPFRTPLYPLVPLLFIFACAFVVMAMVGQAEQRPYALLATLLVAAGLPVYAAQRRRRTDRSSTEVSAAS
ncbi:MAG: APC family permease [Thermoplasmatota archaeon]